MCFIAEASLGRALHALIQETSHFFYDGAHAWVASAGMLLLSAPISWPAQAAGDCAAWLREWRR
jgi:hypothetical protein